jgi:hypothetical protein
MDNRTTASPQSNDGYVHYANGGWSWAVPFYTGLFLLARQVDKNITLEEFHQKSLDTGVRRDDLSVVVAQPERLIDALQKERHNKTQSRANANQIRNIKGNSLE